MNTQSVFNGSSLLIMPELSWYLSIPNLARQKKINLTKYIPVGTLDNVKGKDRKTSGTGSNKKYYEWDHTHNDIEVYDKKGII